MEAVQVDVEHLLQEALKLSPVARAQFIEALQASLDEPDPTIDALWAEEVADRLEALESGEMGTVSSEEVFAEFMGHDRPVVSRSQR